MEATHNNERNKYYNQIIMNMFGHSNRDQKTFYFNAKIMGSIPGASVMYKFLLQKN